MTVIQSALDKPYYVFRPSQAALRIGRKLRPKAPIPAYDDAMLPWGLRLRYRPSEHIGWFIYTNGVYDLCVSEAIWRLLDPGESAIDVGANIGYMTSIMAARVGSRGTVYAFEPHPRIYEELSHNAIGWRGQQRAANVMMFPAAASNCSGDGVLRETEFFEQNSGTSELADGGTPDSGGASYHVPILRLDDALAGADRIGLMKVDVEGHELKVLQGCERLLRKGWCRDIVFEDYEPTPSPTMRYLEDCGYSLFWLKRGFLGSGAQPVSDGTIEADEGPPSCLATLDPERAMSRLRKLGWAIFGMCKV